MNDLAYLSLQMKAPCIAQAVCSVVAQARNESGSFEDFLTVLLDEEVQARQAQGGEAGIRAAHIPARKTGEEFDFGYQTSVRQQVMLHLAALSFIDARDNVIFLGPPGTGKTHLAVALGMKACLAGHRVHFSTATHWVMRLATANHEAPGGLPPEAGANTLDHHRRGGLHPLRRRSGQPLLPARLFPLRTRLGHRHLQQAVTRMG